MSAPPWMPLYIGHYLADTGHLSTAEHGAYLLLIMHYWQNDGLPDDDRRLARICRMTRDEWEEARPTIAELFDGGWRHHRIDEELATARETIEKRSAAGKAGASARHGNRIASAVRSQSERTIGNGIGTTPVEPTPSDQEEASPRARASSRLPSSWTPTDANRDDAVRLGLPPAEVPREAQRFRDYWIAKPGRDGVKADWDATWRNWVSRTCEQRGFAPDAGGGVTPTVWLTTDDPRWPDACAEAQRRLGKPVKPMGSRHEAGTGYHFPAEIVGSVGEPDSVPDAPERRGSFNRIGRAG